MLSGYSNAYKLSGAKTCGQFNANPHSSGPDDGSRCDCRMDGCKRRQNEPTCVRLCWVYHRTELGDRERASATVGPHEGLSEWQTDGAFTPSTVRASVFPVYARIAPVNGC